MRSAISHGGVDFEAGFDRSCDRDFRSAVKTRVGGNVDPPLIGTVSRASEAASVRGAPTAGSILGHVPWPAGGDIVKSVR